MLVLVWSVCRLFRYVCLRVGVVFTFLFFFFLFCVAFVMKCYFSRGFSLYLLVDVSCLVSGCPCCHVICRCLRVSICLSMFSSVWVGAAIG